jgi:hypothetical protein
VAPRGPRGRHGRPHPLVVRIWHALVVGA